MKGFAENSLLNSVMTVPNRMDGNRAAGVDLMELVPGLDPLAEARARNREIVATGAFKPKLWDDLPAKIRAGQAKGRSGFHARVRDRKRAGRNEHA